ncbi:hypothetical protein HJG60_010413 [Phyllostomus discolor]|uniref:Uncharacterized protein n=1 Tax=Phyllostomus discolor TaxID=89673 RepID=A0A834ASW4_9CHIR|nr:hypothetical protein HJG60_010413 [Phyllostomus discolor]
MEGLVPATATATASAFQLILEHLCAILLLVSESLRHVPALPALLSVIPVGALVAVVSLMVNRRLTSGSVKAPDRRCPARDQVCAGRGENTGPMTEADDTPKPPGVEASPLWLQTLCLKALNEHLSRMSSPQDLADLVRAVRRTPAPRRARVTREKPVTKAPGTDREQLQESVPGDLNKNARHPESPELRQDEIGGRKQDVRDQEEEQQGLEPSAAPVERDLHGTASQSLSLGGAPLQASPRSEVLRGHLAQVKSQVERQSEAGNADQSVRGWEGDLKGVPRDADLDVPLPRADGEDQGRARELWEQKRASEELAAEITSLRTEKASLQSENTDLNAEIQQLKLRLQVQPDVYEDRLTRLQKQLLEAEGRCSEMEKKLLDDWRNTKSTYRMLATCKKMAQDMNQELRRSTSHYEKEIRCHWERAEAARAAAEHTERKLQELWKENDRNRQLLARARSTFRPFPGGPFAPAAPPAAYRGPEVPGRPLGRRVPRKEQGHAVGARIQAHLQV